MANLNLTNAEALRAISMVSGYKRAPADWDTEMQSDARAIIRGALRRTFHPMPFHQWRFLERQFTVSGVPAFSTGTITGVAGAITLAGSTWPSWAEDAILRVNGQTLFVDNVTSTTVLEVKDAGFATAALTTFTMHRWRWPMPEDFAELIDGCVYSFGSRSKPLQGANEQEIRLRYATNFQVGNPSRFAEFPGGANDDATRYFAAWPVFDDTAFASTTYRSLPEDKLDDADLTADGTVVQIDAVHAETLLAAIMASAEEYYNHTIDGPHSQRFQQRLMASIEHDRHMEGPAMVSCPKGVNPQRHMMFNSSYPTIYNDLLP